MYSYLLYIDSDNSVQGVVAGLRSPSPMHLPVGCARWPSACEAARGLATWLGNLPLPPGKLTNSSLWKITMFYR